MTRKKALAQIMATPPSELKEAAMTLGDFCDRYEYTECPFSDSPPLNGQCVILEIAGWMEGLSDGAE